MAKAVHNSWSIRRKVNGLDIAVTAEWRQDIEAWELTCRVNGQVSDSYAADDVLGEAGKMIEAAILQSEPVLPPVKNAT